MPENRDRPLLTRVEFRVQTYDVDFAGIVSNIVYIRWLEELRLKMLDEHFPLESQLRNGYVPVLIETEIKYLRALRLFERPIGEMWLTRMTRMKFTLEAEFIINGKKAARATHVAAFVRTDTFHPIPVPSGLIEEFERERL